jgi:hypothetical protein
MRYNRAYVQKAIERIQKNFGVHLDLDHCSQGYKIEYKGRGLSPRGSPNEMIVWLEAFEEGMELMRRICNGTEITCLCVPGNPCAAHAEVNPPPAHG